MHRYFARLRCALHNRYAKMRNERYLTHRGSRNHSVACVLGALPPKGPSFLETSGVISNARSILSLVLPATENTAHEDNRDLRFDLGGNWIKAARLKEDVLSDLSNFLPTGRRREKRKRKEEMDKRTRRHR